MTAHGYARVSTADQNLDRQTDALAPLVDRLWCDRQSGKDMDRPRWRAMECYPSTLALAVRFAAERGLKAAPGSMALDEAVGRLERFADSVREVD